ncbi:outer membrane protein [Parabacteroides sp. PF5-5]|uniref:TolC family protein n=1 Tax=unclassified Parabacteroides TaxID=2649774 RepID=UPI002476D728|nr:MULTISPECIES: TolC family protein [unclassified Parabacteroides]MDH6303703.1 outer membrane protein [Parabacteroides sp. PH5-39]MDH6314320.1 outer membrane protein [Parabacteroides sp. PF5-13]MDH6318616.1 outer membrane protein [Parabacteroides sp. PH5-13]MDH6322092.1 outer membrane protein [Parabacteroides sp. PH5-8]MDH6325829.1 outer membrane protein [Parabacteroides sp. PH5-41]
MKRAVIITCSTIWLGLSAQAQNYQHITVDHAVNIAVENNNNIKMSSWDKKIANAEYHQTDAIFLPQVTVGYTALSTNNPLNAFGFLLQQESVTAMDFDPSKLNNPGATQNYSTQVEAKLPLLNLDMIYARKGAKAQEDMYKYKAERTKEYIEFEVRKAYTQLQMSYQARDILRKSLEDIKQIHQSVTNFYSQGLVQKSDVLNAQVQVNTIESALTKAESNIYNASNGLRLLMGEEINDEVYITDSLIQKIDIYPENTLSLFRSDIMALQKAVDATDMMVKSSKMTFLPRINAFGSYGLNDSKAFKFRNDSYLIGINLSWNIFSGNQNRSKVRAAQFQKNKMQEELGLHIKKEQLELSKAKRDLSDSQVDINKQQISVEQAEEALRILANRHNEGLASTTDLLMAQAQFSQQKLLLSQSIMTYNILEAYLHFLSITKY